MKQITNLKYLLIILITLMAMIMMGQLMNLKKYRDIEKDYVTAAKFIYEENGIENAANVPKIILTRKEINSLLSTRPLEKNCNGYVIIIPSNHGPKIDAYIKCGTKYTTLGYDENLLE